MPLGESGAYWLLLEPDVHLRHSCYDFAKTAQRIRVSNYPEAEDFAVRNVLQPPSEKQILESFRKAEFK